MSVTAKFVPDHIEVLPNTPTTLTLRLYNDDANTRDVTLSVSGDLGDNVRLDSATATIETNQIVDVAVTVLAPPSIEAGTYTITTEVGLGAIGSSDETVSEVAQPVVVVATATVELATHSDYTIALVPIRSGGSKRGRHVTRVANTGNVVVTVELSANATDDDVTVQLGDTSMTVEPGLTGLVSLRVEPSATYWSGPTHDHHFTLDTVFC